MGAVVLALANYVFKFPNHFSFGGVAGFAVILSGMFGGSRQCVHICNQYVTVIDRISILGKEVAMRSFYVSIVFSGVLEVAQYVSDRQANHEPAGAGACIFFLSLLAVCSRYSSSWMRPAEEPILLL